MKYLFFVAGLIVIIGAGTNLFLESQERMQSVVDLKNVDEETLFFYRDDCPDCQKIFKQVYLSGVISGEQKNINLNQEKNRKYISYYKIDQVPTIIQKDKRYEGIRETKNYLQRETIF